MDNAPRAARAAAAAAAAAGSSAGASASGPSGEFTMTPSSLDSFVMVVAEAERLPQLVCFLRAQLEMKKKVMVYFLTCACVDFYGSVLPLLAELKGQPIAPLHGKMNPKARKKAYEWFIAQKEGGVLLCTDVAARGLDLPDVRHPYIYMRVCISIYLPTYLPIYLYIRRRAVCCSAQTWPQEGSTCQT